MFNMVKKELTSSRGLIYMSGVKWIEPVIVRTDKCWVYVINGVILLLFLGLIYAWSIFVTPLEAEFGWQRSETSMAFSICMSMFCIGGLVSGFISKTKKLWLNMILCAVFVLIGFLFASQVTTLVDFYIYYSCFVGFGVGLAYNTILSSVVKWFPDKVGFISGILLMGFGFGGMVLGTACSAIMARFGWRIAFKVLGIILSVIILVGARFVKLPTEKEIEIFLEEQRKSKTSIALTTDMTPRQMILHPSFKWLFLWATLLTAAGLVIISNASPIMISMGASLGASAFLAGLISVSNGLGRIISGIIFDAWGWGKTIIVVTLSFIIASSILIFAFNSSSISLMTLGFICAGLSYGGIVPINSSIIANFYGQQNYAINLSVITLNIIPASLLGPYLAGILQTMSGSYTTTFIAMVTMEIIGLSLSTFIKKPL